MEKSNQKKSNFPVLCTLSPPPHQFSCLIIIIKKVTPHLGAIPTPLPTKKHPNFPQLSNVFDRIKRLFSSLPLN